MARIILLETSTSLCSAAIAQDGQVLASRSDDGRNHAALAAPFVKELLDSLNLSVEDCDAVCVGKGPGSYTGLRVGVSTAKGLCFGAGIPLISTGSLDALYWQARLKGLMPEGCKWVVPMIDARRMEVFSTVFSAEGEQVTPVESTIVSEGSFADRLSDGPVLFIGDGAEKCRPVLTHPNAFFVSCCPDAAYMAPPAFKALEEKRFEDTAYFEPFYLKEFVATVPRKKLF